MQFLNVDGYRTIKYTDGEHVVVASSVCKRETVATTVAPRKRKKEFVEELYEAVAVCVAKTELCVPWPCTRRQHSLCKWPPPCIDVCGLSLCTEKMGAFVGKLHVQVQRSFGMACRGLPSARPSVERGGLGVCRKSLGGYTWVLAVIG